MSDEIVVQARGVTRWFGAEQVLKGVDLDVPRGSVTALLGRNAAGKSTLLSILAGGLGRNGGEATVFGRDVETLRPSDRERIAIVGSTSAFPGRRVRDELALVRRLRAGRWNGEREAELIARFKLPLDKRIQQLSKGQQARVRLLLALSCEPELLLLDEPAMGLDLFARRDFLESVIELVASEERTVVIASHLIDDVERIADRVVFMRDGLGGIHGSVDELRERFRRLRLRLPSPERALPVDALPAELLGVERVLPAEGSEQVVILNDHSPGLVTAIEERTGGAQVAAARMTLRDIYFEVLREADEEVRA